MIVDLMKMKVNFIKELDMVLENIHEMMVRVILVNEKMIKCMEMEYIKIQMVPHMRVCFKTILLSIDLFILYLNK